MPDPDTTDGCDARITGPQRAQLAEVMRVLRMHGDPAVRHEATRLAVLVVELYEQLIIEPARLWATGRHEGPIAMPTPGPGMRREALSVWYPLRLQPQHVGPAAVAVGMGSYAIAALTPWWLTLSLGLGLLALLVYAGRHDLLEVDRMPPARMLRR